MSRGNGRAPILLVEDNPADARLEQEMLADAGVTTPVSTAACLAEALDRLQQGASCLVLDLGLPDATGLESVVALREAAPDVPVVVLTGLMDEAMGAQAVAAGAQDYLVKNEVDGRLLAHAIRYAVERKRSQTALRDVEEREHMVVSMTPIMLLAFDQQGVLTLADGSGFDVIGAVPAQLVGTSLFDRAGEMPALAGGVRAALRGEDTSVELSIGETVWDARLRPLRDAGGRVTGGVCVAMDASERTLLTRTLRTLSAGNQVLVHARDEEHLLGAMCTTIVDTGGYALAWVGYAEQDSARTVRRMAAAGDTAYLDGLRVSWGDNADGRGPTGTAIRTGAIQILDDIAAAAPAAAAWRARAMSHGFGSSIALPLEVEGRVIGAAAIYAARAHAFNAEAVERLSELAGDLAYGISRVRDTGRLDRSLEGTVTALATTVEIRDPYTAGHQRRVGQLAGAVASRLGFDDEEGRGIRIAGAMHDIGKVYVPAEILTRPGRIAPVEFELIKRHSQFGADIVSSVDFRWPVGTWILQHHERLDGSGYPHGCKGDEVLHGSRILAVADVVEAMIHLRPYRAGLGLDVALEHIAEARGVLYDTRAVDACTEILRDGSFSWDE